MYSNLKIRAYLRSGVISDQFLPLDAILYYHFIRNIYGEQTITIPGQSTIKESGENWLPFEKVHPEDNNKWYYKCSFAQWSLDIKEANTFKVKQGDWLRFPQYNKSTKKINQASGKYKSYHIKLYYRTASYVEWFCVGNYRKIQKLLNFCTHVGKNSGDGWGEVLRWELIKWPYDWSVKNDKGNLMRAIPNNKSDFLYGIRPSYWQKKHIFKCLMPKTP